MNKQSDDTGGSNGSSDGNSRLDIAVAMMFTSGHEKLREFFKHRKHAASVPQAGSRSLESLIGNSDKKIRQAWFVGTPSPKAAGGWYPYRAHGTIINVQLDKPELGINGKKKCGDKIEFYDCSRRTSETELWREKVRADQDRIVRLAADKLGLKLQPSGYSGNGSSGSELIQHKNDFGIYFTPDVINEEIITFYQDGHGPAGSRKIRIGSADNNSPSIKIGNTTYYDGSTVDALFEAKIVSNRNKTEIIFNLKRGYSDSSLILSVETTILAGKKHALMMFTETIAKYIGSHLEPYSRGTGR